MKDYYEMGRDARMSMLGWTAEKAMEVIPGAKYNYVSHADPHPNPTPLDRFLITTDLELNPGFDEDAFRRGWEDMEDDMNDLLREDPRAFSGDLPADF